MSPWFYGVAERHHDIQNPTSAEKITLLGERLGLGRDSRVLDVAAGRGGPALLLAREFGARVTCVERDAGFAAAARERAADAGLDARIEVVTADARKARFETGAYDAALCLGATFVWSGLEGTIRALAPAVRPGGHIAIGEPYWRSWPLPDGVDNGGYVPLAQTVSRFEGTGLAAVALISSSEDDWDRYESLHWLACEEWLADTPDDPEAEALRERYLTAKERYLSCERALLGWTILVGRLTPRGPEPAPPAQSAHGRSPTRTG